MYHVPLLLLSARVLVERWPLDQRPWTQFLVGSGAQSELRDYLKPLALGTTHRNHLPRLYQVRLSLRLRLSDYASVCIRSPSWYIQL